MIQLVIQAIMHFNPDEVIPPDSLENVEALNRVVWAGGA
jgi:hypothetical protein